MYYVSVVWLLHLPWGWYQHSPQEKPPWPGGWLAGAPPRFGRSYGVILKIFGSGPYQIRESGTHKSCKPGVGDTWTWNSEFLVHQSRSHCISSDMSLRQTVNEFYLIWFLGLLLMTSVQVFMIINMFAIEFVGVFVIFTWVQLIHTHVHIHSPQARCCTGVHQYVLLYIISISSTSSHWSKYFLFNVLTI